MHKQYYIEKEKVDRLVARKNQKTQWYNGIYDRYEYPVLTREFAPVHWRYDLDEKTNPNFQERLGINAVMNSGAIKLNGKYYLVVRVEGNDRKSFFAVAESDNGIDGFHFWDYPVVLPDTCPEETNVYDMRLTQHEDGWIYGVFCSESKDPDNSDLSAAVAEAGIVRTKDLKTWERLDNLKTLQSPQQRNVCLHPEFSLFPSARKRVGDVSNVVFTNGAIADEDGTIYIYYASCDTRMHVATTTIDKMEDYLFNTPEDPKRSPDCVKQRCELIAKNLEILKAEGEK